MEPATLAALQESIAHHERLYDRVPGERVGPKSCALCGLFWSPGDKGKNFKPACFGCPVRDRTGYPYCIMSPYKDVETAYYILNYLENMKGMEKDRILEAAHEFRNAARSEIRFLKSLLPVEP